MVVMVLLWARAAAKPNVIVVLLDDVGYGDFACHGNPIIKTPNIDRLHGQSVRLTDFHVAPMCTPTRSQLFTGRDALDNGAMNVSSGRTFMRRKIPTLAGIFKDNGYRTASIGKWHLGDNFPHRPQDRGFEQTLWFPSSHISSAPDYFDNDYFNPHLRDETGQAKQYEGYCTDVFFDQSMRWMKERAAKDEPFFLYLPLNAAHGPLFCPEKYREPYKKLDRPLASFYGMIANVDENIGKLDEFLTESKLADNTILIFFTDNGGTVGVKTFNAGMKGSKVTLWEGGHRVPCFIRPAGSSVGRSVGVDVGALTQVQDLFPTLVDLCALKTPAELELAGTSLAPLLSDAKAQLRDRMLVVQFSRMNQPVPERGDAVVLWNKWRLLVKRGELYDVAGDLAQEHNVAEDHAEIVRKMREHYDRWWSRIEPRVNVLSSITIGSEQEPESLLSPADWQNVFLDQQLQVRDGTPRSGAWGLDVAREGTYVFELRRWPREAKLPLTSSAPEGKFVDGKYPDGKALPIVSAKLKVGKSERTGPVKQDDASVTFELPLVAGPTQAQTWFFDANGKELCGAFYVYVRRK